MANDKTTVNLHKRKWTSRELNNQDIIWEYQSTEIESTSWNKPSLQALILRLYQL